MDLLAFLKISGYVSFLINLFIGIFVYLKNRKNPINIFFCLFSIVIAFWSVGSSLVNSISDRSAAVSVLRICYLFAVFLPPLYLHFICLITEQGDNKNTVLSIAYLLSLIISPFVFSGFFIKGLRIMEPYGFLVSMPGPVYSIFIVFFGLGTYLGLNLLYKSIRNSKGGKHNQLKYFFISQLVALLGGYEYFSSVLNIKRFPPLDDYILVVYFLIMAYAILKHRLMDINIALTRAGIFIFVYSFVLGAPFWVGYTTKSWFPATALAVALASLGPFIYQRLRKQAEDIILKDQKAYQNALLETSSKMLLIKELLRLLETAGSTVIKTVKVSFVGIYVEDEKAKKYTCRYKQARERECGLPEEFELESELAQHLSANRLSLIGEEADGSRCKIGLAAPFMVNDVLLGFMLLGEKEQNRAYTQDDVNVFTILANQIAMGIENCQFYAQEKERQALLYQSATLAQMGVMADSMGHQIKNHIQKMTMQSGSLAGLIEEFLGEGITNEKAEQLLRRTVDMLHKIEKQGETGGRLIESISKFSKLPRGEFKQTTIAEMFATANDMLRFKIKFDRIDYVVDIADNLPRIYAHPILGEAFFNLIDNAYDTVMDREDRLKESGYRGRIAFQARCNDSINVEVKIADNGMGVDDRILQHLFLPFYTTKATANKGTGLGLFVIKQIVDNHKGNITIDSKRLKGTTFTILLPLKAAE